MPAVCVSYGVRITFSGRDKQPKRLRLSVASYQFHVFANSRRRQRRLFFSSPSQWDFSSVVRENGEKKRFAQEEKTYEKYFPCDLRLHVCVQQKKCPIKNEFRKQQQHLQSTTQCKGFNDLGAARKFTLVVFYLGARGGQSAVCVRSPTRFMGLV